MIPEFIIIHHSATEDSKTFSWNVIRKYHESLGWSDIGYHCGIELIGNHYEIMLGRLWYESGAHCKQQSMNYRSLGICVVGNFDKIKPPYEQWYLTLRLCRCLMKIYKIPLKNILPHRHFASYKTCPGKLFNFDKFIFDLDGMV